MLVCSNTINSIVVLVYTTDITGELYDILEEYIKTMPCIRTKIIHATGTVPCYVVDANKYANKIVSNLYFNYCTPLIREEFHYSYRDAQYYYFTKNGRYSTIKGTDDFIKIHKENYDKYLLHA